MLISNETVKILLMVSSFRLTQVEVTYSAGEEEIAITLSPLNSLEE